MGEATVGLMYVVVTTLLLGLMGVALYDGHAAALCQQERAPDTCYQALYR